MKLHCTSVVVGIIFLIAPICLVPFMAPDLWMCNLHINRYVPQETYLNALFICLVVVLTAYALRVVGKPYELVAVWAILAHTASDVAHTNLGPYSTFYASLLAPNILAMVIGLFVALVTSVRRTAMWMCTLVACESSISVFDYICHRKIWFSHGVQRAMGGFSSPSSLPVIIFMTLPLIIYLFQVAKRRETKLLYVAAYLTCWLGAFVAFSRGALLACLIGVAYSCWKSKSIRPRPHFWIILCVCFLPVLCAFVVRSADKSNRTLIDAAYRYTECTESWKGYIAQPIWGYGVNRAFVAISDDPTSQSKREYFNVPNNLVVAELLERGAIGLLLFALASVSLWRLLSANTDPLANAIRASLVSLFVAGLFDVPFGTGAKFHESAAVFVVVGMALRYARIESTVCE